MLIVDQLVKRYLSETGEAKGGISGISFDVKEGELFTLLGPSGCGKTTTLRSIAGLERPDDGVIRLGNDILFDGARELQVPMYQRDIGMVFQSYAIWPHMDVFDNVAYPLRFRRKTNLTRSDMERRVLRALEMVGLAEYRNRSATRLSGGQQQRLALARALVREPKLLLLDEPLSNLDALLREQMRSEIKRLQMEWGVTTIYVTHDQSEAMALSDRVAVLNNSALVQVGSPVEIYDRPTSAFVANFIGRTNLLRGKVARDIVAGREGEIQSPLGRFHCQFAAPARAGREITFAIRPENIALSPAGTVPSDQPNRITGTVQNRVFLGEIMEYTVVVPSEERLIVRLHPSACHTDGDLVDLVLKPGYLIAVSD
ncbi:MAG TPA: ABC transporter ATP-binding protein [Paracoccus sp. (in: a-proteobacteria)]|uniref:ABC transporter ATP-binding protein n=1 Tax=Paracoccus sp. TaxID=267 RepID=UPI002CB50066|nr:ABC transporter ATP-binding protein [Paracoccus sp. (in: a-proteobacteria)]HWL55235.1 ABC transporter ATP-binding protein [Paracoccus sp. (in: a-proteobacteria)]